MIEENLAYVRERITLAAKKSPQPNREVTLVAVSKTFPPQYIREAYKAGQRIFGENKVQECLDKIKNLQDLTEIKYHMIGHLQSNKVKYITGVFDLIHSVDRESLVKEMNKRFHDAGVLQDVLIQVNLAGEEQKSGVNPENLDGLVDTVINSDVLRLRGFMLIPPFRSDPEVNRCLFAKMYELFVHFKDQLKNANFHKFDILSMGMSGDFEIAIEEGSNMVRIGTKIFGQRNYK